MQYKASVLTRYSITKLAFQIWEVLQGVGVDGVGGNFPFRSFPFFHPFFSFVFVCFSSLSLAFLHFLAFSFVHEQIPAILRKNGNFTPTPSALTPFEISQQSQDSIDSALVRWPIPIIDVRTCCW